jgi:hypothetical protein
MTLVGTDMVCGRKAYVVLIIPKVKGNPWRKCWIDMYTKYTLKNEQYGPDWPKGRPQSFMFWSSIRFKPVSVRDVKIDAPANVQVVMCPRGKTMVTLDQARRMLGFRILMPMNAPPGYVYDGAETVQLGDWKAIHVRFTNGLNAVSMFESAEPMRLPTQSQGTSNMLSWKEEGTYITLLGNINRSDLEAIKRHIGRDEERQMLAEIIHKTGVTQEVVMRLRNRGFGYQNIGIALIAAKQSGEDPLSLLKSNSAGYSWEELSQRHRFQLQSILKKLQS